MLKEIDRDDFVDGEGVSLRPGQIGGYNRLQRHQVIEGHRKSRPQDNVVLAPSFMNVEDRESLAPLSEEERKAYIQDRIAYQNRLCARLWLEHELTGPWKEYMQHHATEVNKIIHELQSQTSLP